MDDRELQSKLETIEKQLKTISFWQQDVNKLLSRMMQMVSDQGKKSQENEESNLMLQYSMLELQGIVNSLPFELVDPDVDLPIVKPNIMSEAETLDLLINTQMSIARFGDCEFEMVSGRQRWGYQSVDPRLSAKLKETLQSDMDNLLVAINPSFYKSQLFKTGDEAMGIRAYMTPEIRREHKDLLDDKKKYANALVFRNINSEEGFDRLRMIWDKKDCLFVEGKNTGLGVGNDLFRNAGSIERIECPAENCFEKYDEILELTKKHGKDKLIISVLGPTASVLAYDLCKEGYRFIDLGQVDLVYEAFVRKLDSMDDLILPDKYSTSDVIGEKRVIRDITDPVYLSQIVERIE